MDYFYLTVSRSMKAPVRLQGLDTQYYKANITYEDYQKVPKAIVTYFDYREELEIPDFIASPVVLFSSKLRDVFEMYDEEVLSKPVRLFPHQAVRMESYLYWFVYVNQLKCLHEACEKNPNGTIRELILDGNKLMGKDVFRVFGIMEDRVVVSLPVVESILRRKLYGVRFEKVRVL